MFVRIRTRKLSPAFPPDGGAGFFIAVSINRRFIVFGENSASEMTGSRG
jgi:hypothetical protein